MRWSAPGRSVCLMRDLGLVYRGITPKRRSMSTQPSQSPIGGTGAGPIPYELASPAVELGGVKQELMNFVEYLGLVHRVVFNKPLVITSGKDGQHVGGSLHAQGLAVDIRTRDLLPDEQLLLLTLLAYAGPANHIAVFD